VAGAKSKDRGEEPRFVYLVGRVDRGLRKSLEQALRGSDLSVPEYTAMSVLARRPGLSNAQLARRSLISPQSMMDVIARLEQRALVARRTDPSHARILKTQLTTAGEALLGQAQGTVSALEEELLVDLSAAERKRLRGALTSVMQRLRDAH
jgi:DNA-binding MarR family transcriptional regulator